MTRTRLGLFALTAALLSASLAFAQFDQYGFELPADAALRPSPTGTSDGGVASGARQIAVLLPLSGEYEHVGVFLRDAIELALRESPGLSWTVVDSRGDAEVAARRVRELADDPAVLAILGPVGHAESEAAAAVAAERRIPLLALSSREGLEDLSPWVFRLRVSPEEQARQMAQIAVDRLDTDGIAVLFPETPLGESTARAFVEAATAAGGRITAYESYPDDTTDFNDAIELLVNVRYRELRSGRRGGPATRVARLHASPEVDFGAVFVPDFHERVGLVLPFLDFWEVPLTGRVQLLGLSGWAGRGLQKSGDLGFGGLFPVVFHRDLYALGVDELVARYEEAYEREPSEAEAQAYDAVLLLRDALGGLPAFGATRRDLAERLLGGLHTQGVGSDLGIGPDGAVRRTLHLYSVSHDGYVGPYDLLR